MLILHGREVLTVGF